jgi:hypothetical protein
MVNIMENGLNIENITNGLVAIQKIRQLYKKDENDTGSDSAGTRSSIKADRLTIFEETLESISHFFPKNRTSTFNVAFNEGRRYSGAYRDMKQHVRNVDWSHIKLDNVYDGIKLALPLLNAKQQVNMNKVIQVIDIIKS